MGFTQGIPWVNSEDGHMRIGLVTASDARSRESWSGTHYYMAQALQKHCGELFYLGPIQTIVKSAVGDVARILQLLSRKRYWHPRSIVVAMRYARILEQRISKQPLDLLVAPLALSEISFCYPLRCFGLSICCVCAQHKRDTLATATWVAATDR